MKTLKLTLTKKWFDMILNQESTLVKKQEYREIKEFWIRRFVENHSPEHISNEQIKETLLNPKDGDVFDTEWCELLYFPLIEFTNGYGKHRPSFIIKAEPIKVGYGKPEWGAVEGEKYFVLNLLEIVSTSNIK